MQDEKPDNVRLAIQHYMQLLEFAPTAHHSVPHLEPIMEIYDAHPAYRNTVVGLLGPNIDRHIENVRYVMEEDEHFHAGHKDHSRVKSTYQGLIDKLEKLRNQ